MATSSVQFAATQAQGFPLEPVIAMDSTEMDIDMDLDLDLIGPSEPLELQDATDQTSPFSPNTTPFSQLANGEKANLALNKVHIRGVDDLSTADIEVFAAEHFPAGRAVRIEWIDDTSANIIFSTPEDTQAALAAFIQSAETSEDAHARSGLELVNAKPLSSRPEVQLQVRTALSSDAKKPRAHEASRFYMMHPEHDPREKRRSERFREGYSEYRKRRNGPESARRRSSPSVHSQASSPERTGRGSGIRKGYRGDFYRPGRNTWGIGDRERSASPVRLGDTNDDNRGSRTRRRTPPNHLRGSSDSKLLANEGKELFSTKSMNGEKLNHRKELLPNKDVAVNLKKELFPAKLGVSKHRRSGAFDASDETAELFASNMTIRTAEENSLNYDTTGPQSSGTLRTQTLTAIKDHTPVADNLKIRGVSQNTDLGGFSIRGTAGSIYADKVKELFPNKTGNVGKELFLEKLKGRDGTRNRAEDMFY
ncbi:MAG: hypothetical protein Q9167_000846 [Letrouitia subvulpina]